MIKVDKKDKEFRDPVHGYISVPADWCSAFIDTAIFQRLKHIEQTSMRSLYPSAHHDRFTHSLGVYHLAKMAFHHLSKNTDANEIKELGLDNYYNTFRLAALMHDCAHACFSHTLEYHYFKVGKARDFLFSLVDEEFKKDYERRRTELELEPAAHEVYSAAIFLKHYGKNPILEEYKINPIIVARMITGCVYAIADNRQKQVENCLIQLLNGRAIDIDKLDYILRDTWFSGVDNVSIDVQRLLSALEIVETPNGLKIVFKKSALSVVQSVLDGRNYLFRWIYSHHTVCYYSRLLCDAIEALDKQLSSPSNPNEFLHAFFSKDTFEQPIRVKSHSIYLPCDDDIYCLLKAHKDTIPQVEELLNRSPSRTPLWKTHAEFETIFEKIAIPQRSIIRGETVKILESVLGKENSSKILVEPVKPKVIDFDESEIWVKLLGRIVPYKEIITKWQESKGEKKNVSYFYVYIPREFKDKIPECIEKLANTPVY